MVKNTFVFKNTRTKIDKIMQFLLPPSSFSQVLCLAVIASWRFKKSRDFYCYFSKMNYHLEALKHQDADQLQSSDFTFTRVSNVEKVIIKFCSIRSIFFLMIPHLLIRRSLKLVSELGTCVMFALRLEQSWGRLVQRKKERLFFINCWGLPLSFFLAPNLCQTWYLSALSCRDLCLCGSMFVLMVCITYGSPVDEHYKINAALRRLFVG